MTTQNIPEDFTAAERAKFERGLAFLKAVHEGKTFDETWGPIGEGLLAVRDKVMRKLHLTEPRGRGYNEEFARTLLGTDYADMGKFVRSNLLFCMEHLSRINEMRAKWSAKERGKINHPTSMAQRLRKFIKGVTDAPRRNVSQAAVNLERAERAERAKADLEVRLVAMEARVRDGSVLDLVRDKPEDIAKVIAGCAVPNKAQKIHEALGRALTRQKRPAG